MVASRTRSATQGNFGRVVSNGVVGSRLEGRGDQAADVFKALGDPVRIDIIEALSVAGELPAMEIAREVGMSPPAVSYHLQVLQDLRFLSSSRRGRFVYYRVEWDELSRQIDRSVNSLGLIGHSRNQTGRPILIGSTLPLTGFAAEEGIQEQRSLLLAVEEWNEMGGVQGRRVEAIVLDAGDMGRRRMLGNFRSLIEDYAVDAIINGYLFCTGEESDVVVASGTPYLHHNTSTLNQRQYASNPRKYWMCFQCDPPERLYAAGFWSFMRFLKGSPHFRTRKKEIAIVAATDQYSTIIADRLQSLAPGTGWRVSLHEKVDPRNDDWRPVLRAIERQQPDVIYLCDVVLSDNVSFVEAFRESPTPSLVFGQYSPTLPDYATELRGKAEGTITSTVGGYLPGTRGDEYREKFERRWGVTPGRGSAGVFYDQVNTYLTAAAVAGGPEDRRAVCEVLESLWPRGVSGVLRFGQGRTVRSYPTETHDPSVGVPFLIMQVQDGEQKILYPHPYVEAEFRPPPWFSA